MAAVPLAASARRVRQRAVPRYAITGGSTTPASVPPGQTVAIKADFQLGQAKTVATYFEIRDANDKIVSSQSYNNQAFWAGQVRPYTWNFKVPSDWAKGTYRVHAGIFTPDWTRALEWVSDITRFQVGTASSPSPSAPYAITNGSATPGSLAPGQTVTIKADFQLGQPGTVATYFEIRNASDAIVSSQSYNGQVFSAGQLRSYTWSFTVPSDWPAGTYRVHAGIFSPDWVTNLKWVAGISNFAVSTPVASNPPPSTEPPTTNPPPSTDPNPSDPPTSNPPPSTSGRQFYVDATGGSDSNSGTSTSAPWQSLSKVNGTTFQPGDAINFKRGSRWTGTLQVKSSGTSSAPITYQAYGSGAAPQISNAGVSYGDDIVVSGDWNVVRDFLLTNAGQAGIRIAAGGDHNVVRNLEVTKTGLGVQAQGQFELITQNYVHDLTLINNTSSSDWGAVCFWIENSNNEVSYNRGINCRAASSAFGTDGGFVEVWNNGDNLYIHNNEAQDTAGFFELGAGNNGSAANVRVAYNVIHNVHGSPGVCFNGGSYNINISGFRFENNTWLSNGGDGSPYRVFGCRSDLSALTVRNNIFYSDIQIADNGNFTHTNNLYYMVNMVNGSGVGYSLGAGERTGNPLFVDLTGGNLSLQAASPAVDGGTNLGYTRDFADKTVPQGGAPDIGAYEFQP
jgi:hypothetical protein